MPASIYDWTAVWVKSFSWLWPPHRGSELEAVCTAPQVQLRAISKTLLLLLYHLAVLLWIPGERWELGERQVCLLSLRVFLTMGTNADLLLTPPHLHMTETSVATLLSPVAFMCVQIHPVHTSGWSVSRAWFPTGHCTHPAPTIATVPSSRPLYLLELSAGWLSPFSLIPSSHSFSLMSRHHQFLTAVLHLPLSFGCSGAAYVPLHMQWAWSSHVPTGVPAPSAVLGWARPLAVERAQLPSSALRTCCPALPLHSMTPPGAK